MRHCRIFRVDRLRADYFFWLFCFAFPFACYGWREVESIEELGLAFYVICYVHVSFYFTCERPEMAQDCIYTFF